MRVDDLIRERACGACMLAKLEIEGAEKAAQRRVREVLSASPVIAAIVEYSSRAIDADGSPLEALVSEPRGLRLDLIPLAEFGEALHMPANPKEFSGTNRVTIGVQEMPVRQVLAEPAVFRDRAMAAT